MQQISVPKSSIFGGTVGEQMESGKRTILEYFILEGILHFLEQEDCDITPQLMLDTYNAVVDHFSPDYVLGLRVKTTFSHSYESTSTICRDSHPSVTAKHL